MGTITILPETTKTPITLIGNRAGICWGADVTNAEKNYKRGVDCIKSGHGRTFEFPDVHMVIDGFSARVMREYKRLQDISITMNLILSFLNLLNQMEMQQLHIIKL